MGKLSGTDYLVEMDRYDAANEFPHIKIFRFNAPIFYANSELFRDRLYRGLGLDPKKIMEKESRHIRVASTKVFNSASTPTEDMVDVRKWLGRSFIFLTFVFFLFFFVFILFYFIFFIFFLKFQKFSEQKIGSKNFSFPLF